MGTVTKYNNFDLLRLLFALNILFVHASRLSKNEELLFLGSIFNSRIAVAGFFVISGFFIFMSYERTNNLKGYMLKRIRRIFPAYFAVVIFFSFFSFVFSSCSIQQYFSTEFAKYLIANLLLLNFLHPHLPGVFTENPITAVNGVLWAVRVEIIFYILVPIIVYLFGRSYKIFLMATIYLISVLSSLAMQYLEATTGFQIYHFIRVELAMQMTYFISGAALYYYFDVFSKHQMVFVALAIAVMIINVYFKLTMLEPIAFSIIVIYLGGSFYQLGNFAKLGDMSYGIFLLHFPVLQIFVSSGIMKEHPFSGLLTAMILVFAGSLFCWHIVEKPFLHKESHYRQV